MAISIKVCGLCSGEQINSLDAMGVDFCGIIFHEASPRFAGNRLISVELKNKILQCKPTGVFVNESGEDILKRIDEYGLKAVQLCGDESPELCRQIQKNSEVIKVFHMDERFEFAQLKNYEGNCDYFLFDTKTNLHGGSGKKFNWDLLKSLKTATPFFLSGGIDVRDIRQIAAFSHPAFFGVDINSRFEFSPGNKNIALIQTFYDQIKSI